MYNEVLWVCNDQDQNIKDQGEPSTRTRNRHYTWLDVCYVRLYSRLSYICMCRWFSLVFAHRLGTLVPRATSNN